MSNLLWVVAILARCPTPLTLTAFLWLNVCLSNFWMLGNNFQVAYTCKCSTCMYDTLNSVVSKWTTCHMTYLRSPVTFSAVHKQHLIITHACLTDRELVGLPQKFGLPCWVKIRYIDDVLVITFAMENSTTPTLLLDQNIGSCVCVCRGGSIPYDAKFSRGLIFADFVGYQSYN